MTFADKAAERMQLEAEDFACHTSRLYVGYETTYSAFVRELERCINNAYDKRLTTRDLDYLAALSIALKRETVLKHRRFV